MSVLAVKHRSRNLCPLFCSGSRQDFRQLHRPAETLDEFRYDSNFQDGPNETLIHRSGLTVQECRNGDSVVLRLHTIRVVD